MNVGILGGTGSLGRGLTARLAAAGLTVHVGGRDEAAARAFAAGHENAGGCSLAVAAQSDIVVVALPWPACIEVVQSVGGELAGKVVVSAVNRLERNPAGFVPLEADGSAAQAIQSALPDSPVVTAFNHVPARALQEVDLTLDADVVIAGDDGNAVEAATRLVRAIPGLRARHVGPLALAGAIEDFTAVLLGLNARQALMSSVAFPHQRPS